MKKYFLTTLLLWNAQFFGTIVDITQYSPLEQQILQFIDNKLITDSFINQKEPFPLADLKKFDDLLYTFSKNTDIESWTALKGYYKWLVLAHFLTNEKYALKTPSPFKNLNTVSQDYLQRLTKADILWLLFTNLQLLINNPHLQILTNEQLDAITKNTNFNRFSEQEQKKIKDMLFARKTQSEMPATITPLPSSLTSPLSSPQRLYNQLVTDAPTDASTMVKTGKELISFMKDL